MNERLALDDRIGRLIAAYADGAPIEVDPVVMARLAAAGPRRGMSFGVRAAPTSRGLVLVAALMALLLAIVAGALLAGRQGPVDPATVIARYWNGYVGWVFVYDDGRVVLAPGPDVAAAVSLRMLLAPALLFLLALPLIDLPDTYLLIMAMPCGINTVVAAHVYGLNARFSARTVAWSTAIASVAAVIAVAVI